MATQLQPPQPKVVSQEKEVLRAHTVDDPIELASAQPKRSARATMKAYRKTLFIAALIVLLVTATAGWMYLSSYESTDDAQVDGHLHPISARISGTILSVNPDMQDSHFVQAGTVLAEIDPADFQAERDRAQAEYDRLQASSVAAEKDITVISSGSNGRLDLARAAIDEAEDSVASGGGSSAGWRGSKFQPR
jgi:membrane fusion protein, multidrug efflux system